MVSFIEIHSPPFVYILFQLPVQVKHYLLEIVRAHRACISLIVFSRRSQWLFTKPTCLSHMFATVAKTPPMVIPVTTGRKIAPIMKLSMVFPPKDSQCNACVVSCQVKSLCFCWWAGKPPKKDVLEHHIRILVEKRILNKFLDFCCKFQIVFRNQHLFLPLGAHGTSPPCLFNVVQDGSEVKGLDIFFTNPLAGKVLQVEYHFLACLTSIRKQSRCKPPPGLDREQASFHQNS